MPDGGPEQPVGAGMAEKGARGSTAKKTTRAKRTAKKTPKKATLPEKDPIRDAVNQQMLIILMSNPEINDQALADILGISRNAVNKRKLRLQRRSQWFQDFVGALQAVTPMAVNVIITELQKGGKDALDAAMKIAKGLGALNEKLILQTSSEERMVESLTQLMRLPPEERERIFTIVEQGTPGGEE